MSRFLITSQGRTGTKWLAWLMNQSPSWKVTHESLYGHKDCVNFGTCAPAYLMAGSVFDDWQKGVVLRDPRQCVLSTYNRAHAVTPNHFNNFESTYPADLVKYYRALDDLLEDGATALDYRRFSSVDYVQAVCEHFGITDLVITQEMLDHAENSHPSKFTDFEQLHYHFRAIVEVVGMPFYEKWISQAQTCIS